MKKIVVLSSHTPSLFWFRIDMMVSFVDKGYQVYALGNEAELDWKAKFEEKGIEYQQIFVERNGINPLKDIKTLKSIKNKLLIIKPDKIFAFQAKTVIYGGIAARQLNIDEFFPLIAGMGSVFLKDDIKTKIIRFFLIKEYRIGMRHSKTVFFQNREDEEIFRKFRIINNQKVELLPGSGVNLERFVPQKLPKTFGVLCVCRLIRDKGVFEYLEACRKIKVKYPGIKCLLVGPFDSNPSALKPEELQSYIDDGTIEYFGEQEDVIPFYAQCSVFVLPSYREGTPKTNLEAMACKRAILTTDAPGCKETVRQGVNGIMVPIKDVDAIVKGIEYFVNNPDIVIKMAAEGRKMAENYFDVKIVNEKICKAMRI